MKPQGHRKTRHTVAGHQDCSTCHPGPKPSHNKTARRDALRELVRLTEEYGGYDAEVRTEAENYAEYQEFRAEYGGRVDALMSGLGLSLVTPVRTGFDRYFDERMKDPVFAAGYAAEAEALSRARDTTAKLLPDPTTRGRTARTGPGNPVLSSELTVGKA